MYKMVLENRKSKFIPVVVAVQAIMFNMNTLVYSTAMTSTQYAVVSFALYLILIFAGIVTGNVGGVSSRGLKFFCLCTIMILITAMLNRDYNILYIVFLAELAKAVIVTWFLTFREYIKIYVKTMAILGAISLVLHFGIRLIPALLNFGIAVYNPNGIKFYSFILFFESTNEGFRNYGFLSEPGDYQHFANTALLLCLFSDAFSQKERRIFSIILTLTSASTFSPAGYVFMTCIWAAYLIRNVKLGNKLKAKPVTLLCFFIAIAAFIVFSRTSFFQYGVMRYTLGKLNGSVSSSLSIRASGILSGFKVFLNHPLFGNGYTKATNDMAFMMTKFGYHPTSTVSSLLAMFGLPFTLIFVFPFIACFLFHMEKKPNFLCGLLIIVGLMISINNERYMWELAYNIFVVYYVTEYPIYKSKREISESFGW